MLIIGIVMTVKLSSEELGSPGALRFQDPRGPRDHNSYNSNDSNHNHSDNDNMIV